MLFLLFFNFYFAGTGWRIFSKLETRAWKGSRTNFTLWPRRRLYVTYPSSRKGLKNKSEILEIFNIILNIFILSQFRKIKFFLNVIILSFFKIPIRFWFWKVFKLWGEPNIRVSANTPFIHLFRMLPVWLGDCPDSDLSRRLYPKRWFCPRICKRNLLF